MPSTAAAPALTSDEKALLARRARRLRRMSLIATTEAGSGHPSTCLSAADLAACLFFREMRIDVRHADHPANDRLVLSKGHAAPLLYAAWAQLGVVKEDELKALRRADSPLEGHPTPRFSRSEAATGSLGQGLSIGLGMALGARLEGEDCRIFVLLGDGETAEGAVWEAAAMAGAGLQKADRLVAIVDVNGLGQSQRTSRGHDTAWYARAFEAFGWRAIEIDGHDLDQIARALESTRKPQGLPVAILARTRKGEGVSWMADQENWHGKPVPREKLASALAELKDDGEALPAHRSAMDGSGVPTKRISGGLLTPPPYKPGEKVATRNAYGAALARLGADDPRIVALDGDTKNSTMSQDFLKAYPDRFFECFIAEQNMVGVAAGLAARGWVPFASTFAAFMTRAGDFIRMAAVGQANLKLCGSHCGVSIGEDGPSQMGLEDMAMMRAVPGAAVLYPSDAVSAEWLVREAAKRDGVVYLRTTRPATPVLYGAGERFPIGGSKVVRASAADRVTIVAAGITLHEALAAHAGLAKAGIAVRVVDAYSVKPLDEAGISKALAETGGRLVVVEDHYAEGGLGEAVLSALTGKVKAFRHLAVREMPRSAPPAEQLAMHGIDEKAIANAVREISSS